MFLECHPGRWDSYEWPYLHLVCLYTAYFQIKLYSKAPAWPPFAVPWPASWLIVGNAVSQVQTVHGVTHLFQFLHSLNFLCEFLDIPHHIESRQKFFQVFHSPLQPFLLWWDGWLDGPIKRGNHEGLRPTTSLTGGEHTPESWKTHFRILSGRQNQLSPDVGNS